MYRKKIRDLTVCVGFIELTEDGECVSYRDISFSIAGLRVFVKYQVVQAQKRLEGVLLLHPLEEGAAWTWTSTCTILSLVQSRTSATGASWIKKARRKTLCQIGFGGSSSACFITPGCEKSSATLAQTLLPAPSGAEICACV